MLFAAACLAVWFVAAKVLTTDDPDAPLWALVGVGFTAGLGTLAYLTHGLIQGTRHPVNSRHR